MKSLFLITICLSILISCSEEEPATYNVDPVFQAYVDQFETEAAKRGRAIDFSIFGLTIQFGDLSSTSFAGQCSTLDHSIEIDRIRWDRLSDTQRLQLIFHELGHCTLIRNHDNTKLLDGTWKSIMRGSPFLGTDSRIPVSFFGFRKDYYLDELFDASVPAPWWSVADYQYDKELDRQLVTEIENVHMVDEMKSSSIMEYEFELEFSLPVGEDNVRIEWGASNNMYSLIIQQDLGIFIALKPDEDSRELLHYMEEWERFNNMPIQKITVRQGDNEEQIYINDALFYVIDKQAQLIRVQAYAWKDEAIYEEFKITKFQLNYLK